MIALLTVLHLFVCFFLILVVLLQTGKGADLAGAFGGGGSQTAFGARGAATLLSKLTTTSAVVFMITSFSLAIMASKHSGSVVTDEAAEQQSAPAPAPPALPVPATLSEDESPSAVPPVPEEDPGSGDDAAPVEPPASDAPAGSDEPPADREDPNRP